MGISKDWSDEWKHPHEGYGRVIDYDGVRWGTANGRAPKKKQQGGGATDPEFMRRHQDKLLLRRLGEEVKRATRIAGLETAEELMFLLSTLVYGVPRETWVIHRSEGFKRPGQICKW
tara:strand:+ start:605 stop:955 length:351 start_codon:yes stop_codon:yes gene_type:complete